MKSKLLPIILLSGLMLTVLSASQAYGQTQQNKQDNQKKAVYTCTMHPEVVQDKTGKCPKCSMNLVEKKDMSKGDMHEKSDTTCRHIGHDKIACDSIMKKRNQVMLDSTNMKDKQAGM